HPYSRSILGREELLRQYSPNQMRCFHRTHYQPENMTLVLVGGIRLEEALSLVETSFNNFSIRSECPKYLIQSPAPITEIKRKSLNLPRLEVSRLLMGWSCPGVSKIEDGFALEVLSVILAGGRCSRLVRQLREEKHLVLDIHSGFSLQKDSSLFTICAWLDSNNIDLVEAIIREHLYNLQTKLVAPEELQRVKRLLLNDYIFSSETPGQLAGIYGYYQTIATADVATKYAETIKNIQPAELQAVAQKYLSPEKYAIVSMKPC
ncbi:MAG: insulinase family protein, partial [Cyanobacteria bacterium J083]